MSSPDPGSCRWVYREDADAWFLQEKTGDHTVVHGGAVRSLVLRAEGDNQSRWVPFDRNGKQLDNGFPLVRVAHNFVEMQLGVGGMVHSYSDTGSENPRGKHY